MTFTKARKHNRIFKEACWGLWRMHIEQADMDKVHGVCKKLEKHSQTMIRRYQFDQLDLAFIPRYLPLGSIGNYEHLDMYVKAMLMGMCQEKKLLLLIEAGEVNNPAYLNCWKDYVTFVRDPLLINTLKPLEEFLTLPLQMYIVLDGKITDANSALGIVGEEWVKNERSK